MGNINTKKKIIVTGNLGFIGCWTTLSLLRLDYDIIGIDNKSSLGKRLAESIDLQEKVLEQYYFDINETKQLISVLEKHRPEAIINIAGQAIVPLAFKEPMMTYKTNTLGTLSILEAARITKIPNSVICITSDKVYQNNNQIWPYRENDQLGGKDIYSVSKSSAELIAAAYAKTHLDGIDINIQTVRLGNVVGGGDWSLNRLIPDFMNAIKNKKTFYVRYPEATRPFQHVLDVVDGIINITHASLKREIDSGEGWNLGPKNNTYAKVKDIINECSSIWPNIKVEPNPVQVKEDLNLSVEVSKYTRTFRAPCWTSLEAIQVTVQWYKNFFSNNISVDKLIENDLKLYEDSHA